MVRCCVDALAAAPGVQARATVGGNICGALPAAAMLSLSVASESAALIWCPNGIERTVPSVNLVVKAGVPALRPGEVLRSVTVGLDALSAVYALRRVALTPDSRTAVLVIATRWPDPCARVTVSVTGAVAVPRVVEFAVGVDPQAGVDAVASWPPEVWLDDAEGSAQWRRAVAMTFVGYVLMEIGVGDE